MKDESLDILWTSQQGPIIIKDGKVEAMLEVQHEVPIVHESPNAPSSASPRTIEAAQAEVWRFVNDVKCAHSQWHAWHAERSSLNNNSICYDQNISINLTTTRLTP